MSAQSRSHYAVGQIPLPFAKWGDSAAGFLMLAALPVRLPLRRNIGLGLVSYTALFITTLFMLGVSWWSNFHLEFSLFGGMAIQNGNDTSLRNYALFVFLPLGIWQHMQRLKEEKAGAEPHNFWPGDGWWGSFLPLPSKYIDMFIDPFLAILAGALLHYRLGCELLGFWIMLSGVALCAVEVKLFLQARALYRMKRDGIKEAHWGAEMLQTPKRPEAAGGGKSASIPTGQDAGLAAEIEKRRREMESEGEGVEA